MRVLLVAGARPNFMKISPIYRASLHHDRVECLIVHTGQHYDYQMSQTFFDELEIPAPAFFLDAGSGSHAVQTARIMMSFEEACIAAKPDVVMVVGDVNSTLACSVVAKKLNIQVAHVEAGLRSFDLTMPEEINRILTDRISDFLFCPTETAILNLKDEGFVHFPSRVVMSGDVMYDVAIYYSQLSSRKSNILQELKLEPYPFILATLHRQENTDDPARLNDILQALNDLSEHFRIVLPLHPRTKNIIARHGIHLKFHPIDPVGYFDMMELLKRCSLVITDSGGLQKESYFFTKHCLVVRDETEWTELVYLEYNFLVGADKTNIVQKSMEVRNIVRSFDERPYGNGDAAKKIARILKDCN